LEKPEGSGCFVVHREKGIDDEDVRSGLGLRSFCEARRG
jgi:hypothetical protein